MVSTWPSCGCGVSAPKGASEGMAGPLRGSAGMIRTTAVGSTSLSRRAALLAPIALAGCITLPTVVPLTPVVDAPPPDLAFTMSDGAVLPARRWLPDGEPGRVVLALHGMNDSRDWFAIPAPALTAAGVAVYAPDQRGFGQAPGRGLWPGVGPMAADAHELLRQLRARHPAARLFLAGESMGGAVAMVAATSPGMPPVDGTILLSPAVWGRAQLGVVLSTGLWLASSLAPDASVTGREVPVVRVVASDNRDALLALGRDKLTIRRTRFDALRGLVDLMDAAQAAAPRLMGPTLALYGARDMLVPEDAMARAWRAMPDGVRRGLYPRGYHLLTRDLNRAAPLGDIVAWTADPGGWLPSGADLAAAAWRTLHH